MAEALLRRWGSTRFRVFSAGSDPLGDVHPLALKVLSQRGLMMDGLRSKSWDEFAAPDALPLHFVVTVGDGVASRIPPSWPGDPITAHWDVADPAATIGTPADQYRAFVNAFRDLSARVSVFAKLRLERLDLLEVRVKIDEIGKLRTLSTICY